MARTWLVTVSIGAHFAVGVGLFATGVWDLEKLESDYRMAGIGMMTPTQTSGGSPAELPAHSFKRKQQPKRIAKGPVQPTKAPEDEAAAQAATAATSGTGNGLGDGTGTQTGSGEGIQGVCAVPPCSGANVPELPLPPRLEPKARTVPPTAMSALRISGNTQIHPSPMVKKEISADGKQQVVGVVKVCLSASGTIASATMLSSTKYPPYDEALLAGVRSWRYRPYTIDGAAVPACSAVSFVYSIK
jgi:protein TonB